MTVLLSVFSDICSGGCTADNVRRGVNVHLYTASENVAQCHVGRVSLHRRSLASRKHCLSLLQGSIHEPRSRA